MGIGVFAIGGGIPKHRVHCTRQSEPEAPKLIYEKATPYQTIQVFKDPKGFKYMKLGKEIQFHEADEKTYHMGMIYPIVFLNSWSFLKILVIGGGDGGTIRELLKIKNVESIECVEIDKEVINTSMEYFPSMASSFKDPRVNVIIEDGAEFLKKRSKMDETKYDMIIMDLTEDGNLASPLNSNEFIHDCKKVLSEGGILVRNGLHEYPLHFTHKNYFGVNLEIFGMYYFSFFNDKIDYKREGILNKFPEEEVVVYDCCCTIV